MSETPIYPKKAWTLLLFIAGDNDLEPFAYKNLAQLQSLPSDEFLHVVAQVDGRANGTRRYRIVPSKPDKLEQVGEPLGQVNTGDPTTLTNFVTWGREHFPAEQTALVIWGHGTGLRDLPANFDYSSLRSEDVQAVKKELQRTLFRPTLGKLLKTQPRMRGIAVDATARDYLDTQELQQALADAQGNGARLDLLGFDACLMNTIEIAYQLRHLADVMVGSQEAAPGSGWPYRQILASLAATPTMSARQLAETIVTCYGENVGRAMRSRSSPYTQSALALAEIEPLFKEISHLTSLLTDKRLQGHTKIKSAFRRQLSREVKRFKDRDLVDLRHWCKMLAYKSLGVSNELRDTLRTLQKQLTPGSGAVLAKHAHGGNDSEQIHGLSIYWPNSIYSATYDKLDFATSGWGELSKQALKQKRASW